MSYISPELRKLLADGSCGGSVRPIDEAANRGLPIHIENDASSYITFYTDECRREFRTGTALEWDVLFNASLGGNFKAGADTLRITAWNRAALGCESYIMYKQSDSPILAVCDHNKGTSTFEPISDYASCVKDDVVAGVPVLRMRMYNLTYRIDDLWHNEVYMRNPDGGEPVLAYESDPYEATLEKQMSDYKFDGAYGPTVEPSRSPDDPFKGISPVGWDQAKLATRTDEGRWTTCKFLDATNSTVDPRKSNLKPIYSQINWAALLLAD